MPTPSRTGTSACDPRATGGGGRGRLLQGAGRAVLRPCCLATSAPTWSRSSSPGSATTPAPGRRRSPAATSAYYLAVNRNKRSVALDLKRDPDGRRLPRAWRPGRRAGRELPAGAAERLGLGYEALAGGNPGLVYCSISGFGQSGPRRDLPGSTSSSRPMSGLMSITGQPGASRPRSGCPGRRARPGCTRPAASWPPSMPGRGTGRGPAGRGQPARLGPGQPGQPGVLVPVHRGPATGHGNRHHITRTRPRHRPLVVAVGKTASSRPSAGCWAGRAAATPGSRRRPPVAEAELASAVRASPAQSAADWVADLAAPASAAWSTTSARRSPGRAPRPLRSRWPTPAGCPRSTMAFRPPRPPTSWPRRPLASTPRVLRWLTTPPPGDPGLSRHRSRTSGWPRPARRPRAVPAP